MHISSVLSGLYFQARHTIDLEEVTPLSQPVVSAPISLVLKTLLSIVRLKGADCNYSAVTM